ncbi:MAG: ATP-binding protein [Alphaproteobacteria bacterium]
MAKVERLPPRVPALNADAILQALPDAVLVLDREDRIVYANSAAEQLLQMGLAHLRNRPLSEFLAEDHPVFSLAGQVRESGGSAAEHGLHLVSPKIGSHEVSLQLSALDDRSGHVSVTIHELTLAQQIDRRLLYKGAARSMTAMAAVLAHEVKNPLSGIRGAAQLLETEADPAGRELTRLICDETDRICALVDRMEGFGDQRVLPADPVNLHEVLDHVQRLARAGFARHATLSLSYDPSLPPARGNRDQLVQVCLNLVKNAAEALPATGGEIILSTAYRHGLSVSVGGGTARIALPLIIEIQDNGPGIPDDLKSQLFDPFVTTKASGAGLGLALSAKIVDDHGGILECESAPRRTIFRVMLPVYQGAAVREQI